MKIFEVLIPEGGAVFVEAPNAHSARFRGATLFKLIGLNINPYALIVWEMN